MYVVFKPEVTVGDKEWNLLDIMNPPGSFESGKRARGYSSKNLLPLSGKLIPEFANRQSIREMFFRRSQSSQNTRPGDVQPSANITNIPGANPPKRHMNSSNTRGPPSKRVKQEVGPTSFSAGQSTLQRFFGVRSTCSVENKSGETAVRTSHLPSSNIPSTQRKPVSTDSEGTEPMSVSNNSPETGADLARQGLDLENDRIVNKESWSRLFSKKKPPRCEGHDEECISLVTKKPGINRGRAFWICPRPVGPSGNKEVGTEWRCPTFIWCSDWSGG